MSRIGILEDSFSLALLIRRILEQRGYEVETYTSIEEAQALLKAPPDLLICDVRLGDGDGIDFLERMSVALGEARPPVLVLSALGAEEDLLRGYDAGADEYLTKPVSMGELLAKVSMLLARRRRGMPAPEADDARLPGGQLAFGRYRVERKLGAGAFGAVYAAHDQKLDQRVALKVLHTLRGAELLHRQRFLRESYTLSLVESPHVVRLIDFGEQEGRLYAALEFVKGPTLLKQVALEGPLGREALLHVLDGTAQALDVLSQHSLVHRDIKPENVILRDGDPARATLIDFGLAKSGGDHMLTKVGTVLGTPAFMSPEQISGSDLSHASDQFSLALTARFALTGETAFPALTGVQLLSAMAQRRVSFPDTLDPGLRAVLERMTALRPEHRYPTPAALLRDLRRLERSA
ncbi:MAG: protein kinase [Planctomycetota bacterium]